MTAALPPPRPIALAPSGHPACGGSGLRAGAAEPSSRKENDARFCPGTRREAMLASLPPTNYIPTRLRWCTFRMPEWCTFRVPPPALSEAKGKVLVLGDDHRLVLKGILPDRGILCFAQPNILHVLGVVAAAGEKLRERGRQLGINDKAHCSAGDEYRVVGFRSGVFQTGEDVAGL